MQVLQVFGPRPSVNAMHTVVAPSRGGANPTGWGYQRNDVCKERSFRFGGLLLTL